MIYLVTQFDLTPRFHGSDDGDAFGGVLVDPLGAGVLRLCRRMVISVMTTMPIVMPVTTVGLLFRVSLMLTVQPPRNDPSFSPEDVRGTVYGRAVRPTRRGGS